MTEEVPAGTVVIYNGREYIAVRDSVDGKVTLSRPGLAGAFTVLVRSTICKLK
jgi:hypothetical protein